MRAGFRFSRADGRSPARPGVVALGEVRIQTWGDPAIVVDDDRVTVVVAWSDAEALARSIHAAGADVGNVLRSRVAPFVALTATRGDVRVARDAWAGRPVFVGPDRASTSLRDLADSSRPNLQTVARYLIGAPPAPRATFTEGVERVMPGEVAVWSPASGWRHRAWFDWRIEPVREPIAEAAVRLRELLDDAVAVSIKEAASVGVSLSGGMDSSSVAASLRAVAPDRRLFAFGVPFAQPEADEQALQAAIADRLGLELGWAPLGDASPWLGGPDAFFDRFAEPPLAPNMFFVDAVAAAATQAGVDRVLDGIDGDGVVGGNWRFISDLLVRLRWSSLARELAAIRRTRGVSPARALRAYGISPLRPRRRGRHPRLDARGERLAGLEPDAWRPGGSFTAAEDQGRAFDAIAPVLDGIAELWSFHGIDVAHPFMDPRVRAFGFGLPRAFKVREGQTKIVLRVAMRDRLPAAVVDRVGKARMGQSFVEGLRRDAPILNLALANLSEAVDGMVVSEALDDPATRFRMSTVSLWLDRQITSTQFGNS